MNISFDIYAHCYKQMVSINKHSTIVFNNVHGY